jgi:hypothetical protein
MSRKTHLWTQEEIELLKSNQHILELVNHPLMKKNNRGYRSIESKLFRINNPYAVEKDNLRRRLAFGYTEASLSETLFECSVKCLDKDVCDETCEKGLNKNKIKRA